MAEIKKKGGRPARGPEPCNCPVSGRVTQSNLDHLDLQAVIRTRDSGRKVTRSEVLNDAVTEHRKRAEEAAGIGSEAEANWEQVVG